MPVAGFFLWPKMAVGSTVLALYQCFSCSHGMPEPRPHSQACSQANGWTMDQELLPASDLTAVSFEGTSRAS